MLGRRVQDHVTRRRFEDGKGDFVRVDVRLVHALVEELLRSTPVVIDSPVALVAAGGAAVREIVARLRRPSRRVQTQTARAPEGGEGGGGGGGGRGMVCVGGVEKK